MWKNLAQVSANTSATRNWESTSTIVCVSNVKAVGLSSGEYGSYREN